MNRPKKTFDTGPIRTLFRMSTDEVEIGEKDRRLLATIEAQRIKEAQQRLKRRPPA